MHSLHQTRLTRPARARRLAAAGIVTLGLMTAFFPAFAQRADQSPGIQTPFGRAPLTFADIVEKVRPAVVSISVSSTGRGVAGRGRGQLFPDLPEDHPFFDFFKRNRPEGNRDQPRTPQPRAQSQGSGFVISADGYVVTNNHVIEGASRVQVSFDENTKFDAEVVGTDARTDLALLKIKGTGTYPFVKMAAAQPRVGDWVLAVGNPYGFGGTVTAGIVSALGREVGSGPYEYMQIDAAVNKGNSGGPTFNLQGEVVGVNTAIYSPSGGNVGIAFAIPAKTVNDVVGQLIKTGNVQRGWLGVKIKDLDADMAAGVGIQVPAGGKAQGAFIEEVTAGGPAEKGGMKAQDVVVNLNGKSIVSSRDLAKRVAEMAPGTIAAVEVLRHGAKQNLSIPLGNFPSQAELAKAEPRRDQRGGKDRDPSASDIAPLGLSLAPGKGGMRIIEVNPGSDAADKGLRTGDVILEINGVQVSSAQDVQASLKRIADLNRTAAMLRVQAGDSVRNVPIRIGAGGERRDPQASPDNDRRRDDQRRNDRRDNDQSEDLEEERDNRRRRN